LGDMLFIPQFTLVPKEEIPAQAALLLFTEKENRLIGPESILNNDAFFLPISTFIEQSERTLFIHIGNLEKDGNEIPLFCVACHSEFVLEAGLIEHSFGDIFRDMEREEQIPFARAKQILTWERTHRFCGSCGSETELHDHEPCRSCPSCGAIFYPRFSPAVIVRITRGRQLLLAHNKNFPEGLYSVIAGFVEAGESLEETVRREIQEEVSLEVENIRYFDSQQWPMPHSLMLGFTAECPLGEPTPDKEEIVDAAWYDPENLPEMPKRGSIARRLIDDHLEKLGLL
jgi:NAD+ diphosphatase